MSIRTENSGMRQATPVAAGRADSEPKPAVQTRRMRHVHTAALMSAALLLSLPPLELPAATRTWDGGGANSNASTAANWSNDTAPVTGDAIVLDTTTHKSMKWDLDISVASWRQVGYTGTVEVATVYPGQGAFTNFTILGDCIISNGVWTHANNSGSEVNRLCVTILGNLITGPDGAIDVIGKGYVGRTGPGYTGSHGGRGVGWGNLGGLCYGSIVAPINLGSAGYSVKGGGAVLLTIGGELRHAGLITADGISGNTASAGGSIWLTSGSLSGAGVIRANGYGGGRVALTVTNAGAGFQSYAGTVTAFSGGKSYGAGTVYLRVAGEELHEGTLIVDNGGTATAGYTEISSNVTGTLVRNVILRGGGVLALATNQTLTVSGTWSNSATFVAQSGSQVIFAGGAASTSVLYGSTTFMSLICTNAGGKTILFEAGSTNMIAAGGQLTLMGEATATNLSLRSTLDGTAWNLNVNGAATQSVRYVNVKNSDALSGAAVGAFDSLDRGGNLNWVFSVAGQTNAWTGGADTAWNLGENWSLGHAPLTEDFVLIPSGCPRYPVLDTAKSLTGGLKIETGAALSLAGYNLTVKTNAVIAGTLTAFNTETITFLADVDFTGGTFTPVDSTLVIGGARNQAVNLANNSFYMINVTNRSGTISFGAGFSAGELRCEAVDGTCDLMFQQGEDHTLRSLVLLGSPAARNIALRSSSAGQKWNLNVTGGAVAMGVDVSDSDASGGKPIHAISSTDGSGNSNWRFGENWSVWIGANNADFYEAANWSPAGTPDSSTRVLIAGTNTALLSGPASVLTLAVSGSLTVSGELTVMEDLTILAGGVATMNRPVSVRNNAYVLSGATLTHSPNTTEEVNMFKLTVHGDMSVDTNGTIDVSGKGYAAGRGPGATGGESCSASYGGYGTVWYGETIPRPCYGSIVAPTNLGSGGGSTYSGSGSSGGGAIMMSVHGTLLSNGLIASDGRPATACSGSGGSIRLICGAISGASTIRATGGTATYGGGGGRISLVVTNAGADFQNFSGQVLAYGGSGARPCGAGTIFLKRAADRPRRGAVWLNNNGHGGNTDVPPLNHYVTGEAEFVSFNVTNGATLRLTNDVMLGDIWLHSTNSWLDLGGRTLTVRSREHPLGPGTVLNYGEIIWWPLIPKGTLFIAK